MVSRIILLCTAIFAISMSMVSGHMWSSKYLCSRDGLLSTNMVSKFLVKKICLENVINGSRYWRKFQMAVKYLHFYVLQTISEQYR
jgi:hypothetical protein